MAYTEQQKNAFTKISKNNDEWYTPRYAILPILEFLPSRSVILCPFDTKESEFVKVLQECGHFVEYSHKNTVDYKEWTKSKVDAWGIDYIISNPPFSQKNEVLNWLYEVDKPFMMIFPLVSTLETNIRFNIFKDKDIQLLLFNKRINFISGNEKVATNPPFPSMYLCHKVLPKQIIWKELEKNGSK